MTLEAGRSYTFETTGRSNTSVALYDDPDAQPLAQDDDGGKKRNFLLQFTPQQTTTHWIRVQTTPVGKRAKYTLVWR